MKKNIGFIPLAILTILMIHCFYITMTSTIAFSYEHYLGIAIIVGSVITIKIKPVIGRLITLTGLIAGTFSFVAFTPVIEYHRIGFSSGNFAVDIKIQVYCLVLLILFVFLNINLFKMIFTRKSLNK